MDLHLIPFVSVIPEEFDIVFHSRRLLTWRLLHRFPFSFPPFPLVFLPSPIDRYRMMFLNFVSHLIPLFVLRSSWLYEGPELWRTGAFFVSCSKNSWFISFPLGPSFYLRSSNNANAARRHPACSSGGFRMFDLLREAFSEYLRFVTRPRSPGTFSLLQVFGNLTASPFLFSCVTRKQRLNDGGPLDTYLSRVLHALCCFIFVVFLRALCRELARECFVASFHPLDPPATSFVGALPLYSKFLKSEVAFKTFLFFPVFLKLSADAPRADSVSPPFFFYGLPFHSLVRTICRNGLLPCPLPPP